MISRSHLHCHSGANLLPSGTSGPVVEQHDYVLLPREHQDRYALVSVGQSSQSYVLLQAEVRRWAKLTSTVVAGLPR